jgi:hypothetical protein
MVAETETKSVSFFDRPGVEKGVIQVGRGIPFGFERVTNSSVGLEACMAHGAKVTITPVCRCF